MSVYRCHDVYLQLMRFPRLYGAARWSIFKASLTFRGGPINKVETGKSSLTGRYQMWLAGSVRSGSVAPSEKADSHRHSGKNWSLLRKPDAHKTIKARFVFLLAPQLELFCLTASGRIPSVDRRPSRKLKHLLKRHTLESLLNRIFILSFTALHWDQWILWNLQV